MLKIAAENKLLDKSVSKITFRYNKYFCEEIWMEVEIWEEGYLKIKKNPTHDIRMNNMFITNAVKCF